MKSIPALQVRADRNKMQQVMLNLSVQRLQKYSPDGGSVHIGMRQAGGGDRHRRARPEAWA
jgi:signal transduction histidine kinase